MLPRLIELVMRRRGVVLAAAIALIAAGACYALRLPMDAVPDITNPQVQINTAVPALAPEEIEQQVTFPIESRMAGLPGMKEFRSLSKSGLSQVTMVFDDDVDIYRVRQLVSERLQSVLEELPPGLTPKLSPIATGLGEIFYYTVDYAADAKGRAATRKEQLMELRLLHESVVKPLLRRTPGLAEVNTTGGYERQIVIHPDPARLTSTGITFADLAGKIRESTQNAGGGLVEIGGEQIIIRANSRVTAAEQIAEVPLKFGAGVAPLLVRDVASVGIGSNFRSGAATVDGEEALVCAAIMLAGENSRLVSRAVGERLAEIERKLPPGITLRPLYDRSHLVNRTLRTVETNLVEGALLVIAVLFLLLGNLRGALIVALAIPLSMLCAIIGMVELGIPGNLMSLGAIDFGLIVDGAVVMVENILRRLGDRQHALGRELRDRERLDTVLTAAKEVASPMFFGVMIITVVYVPILALSGIEGKMFKPMAVVVMLALGGSLVLALTLMPVLCSFLIRGRISEQDNWFVRGVKRLYTPLLHFGLRQRWAIIVPMIALFGASLVVFHRMGAELLPELDEGDFTAFMVRSASAGLAVSIDMQCQTERVLREKFPEITHTFSRIGTDEIGSDPMGVNVSDAYLMLRPPREWRRENGAIVSRERLIDLMREELTHRVPGQSYLFSQPIEMRFNEILEGTRADVAIKIFGDNFETLEALAGQVLQVIEKVPGADDVEFDAVGRVPTLEITPNREALRKFNLHAEDVNRVVSTALAGEEVGRLVDGNRRHPIVVRLAEEQRMDLDMIRSLPVANDSGGLLRLEQVAAIKAVLQVSTIAREDGQRRAGILVNVRDRDLTSFVAEARKRMAEAVTVPPGYFVEFGGQFQNYIEARQRLAFVVPVALGLIFALIFITFGSLRQAVLIFLCVPLAVTGGVFALAVRDMPFTISAAVGFIALSGIAVLNGIMLISFINQLREQGRGLREAVVEGTLTRLRPKLMTALVASLGFVPMAVATGAGAEVQRPLATVVIGGIVTSTFLTLLVVPVLYEWLERKNKNQTNTPAPELITT
jgi:cobalt-zinc-cadmium resistance protein CzcA